MIGRNNAPIPFWLAGVLLALLLIALSAGGRLLPENTALRDRFKLQPTSPAGTPIVSLPSLGQLPAQARELAERVRARFQGGDAVPALTPVAASQRVRVDVANVSQTPGGVRVSGTITNISSAALDVPVRAFELHDSAGAIYASGAGGSVSLAPNASTPLDVTVPLPAGRGLLLRVLLPPDPPIEQVLLVASL